MSKERTQIAELSELPPVVTAAVATLRQGEQLLDGLAPDAYTAPCPLAFGGTIGRHYRHCLDHYLIFVRDHAAERINFDARERDTELESDPETAFYRTRCVRFDLENLDQAALDRPLTVITGGSPEAHTRAANSTVGRELHYVTMHAIHHYALIAIIARSRGVALDPEFGVAPSTLEYQRRGALTR